MDLISIMPKNMWNEMMNQPRVMLLTHLVEKYPEYAEAARNSKNYKILDNSIVELGESVTLDRILRAAELVKADEIILRDAYPNGPKTIERIKEDIDYLKEYHLQYKYKIMAVCHGENLDDFKKTFDFINSIPEITCIGIPKVLSKWCGDRASLFDIFKDTDKEIHFLGSWYSLKELIYMPKQVFNKIRSLDTCLPSLLIAQHKSLLDDRDGTIDLEKNYYEVNHMSHEELMMKLERAVLQNQLVFYDRDKNWSD